MTTAAEHSQIISSHNRFIRGKARAKALLCLKVTNEYQRLIKKLPNQSDDYDLRESLKERFDLTDRKLNHILDNKQKYLNAKEQAFTSGMVMRHYAEGIRVATEALDNLNEYLDHIDTIGDGDWVDVEKYAGAKGDGIKALSPREAKRAIFREKVDIINKSFEPLKALAPKIIRVQDETPSYATYEEMEEQERILKEELKID